MPTDIDIENQPTFAIETHGCKLNQADTLKLAQQFIEAGYRQSSTDKPTDVYVVNTCTVTHVADRKARHSLRSARRRNPEATIVAAGCYPQHSPDALKGMDEVDLVIGNTDKASLVRQVSEWRGQMPVPCATGDDVQIISPRLARTRAMVKIQEGCDQVCAYCIVPKVRGRERSIPTESIVDEINMHVASGFKEVVLTGTQLGSYGFEWDGSTLEGLLSCILKETEVKRLRVSSLQPQEISPELLELWSDNRLCPHFHLPLQSGSTEILRLMRRRYDANLYAKKVDFIRRNVSDVSITADVIVGFPGETEDDFQQTYELCQQVEFSDLHVFPYSIRPGTSAAHFDAQVSAQVKSERVKSLIELGEGQANAFRERFIGDTRSVLWEGQHGSGDSKMWSGLTDNYIRVLARSDMELTNQILQARLISMEEGFVICTPKLQNHLRISTLFPHLE